MSIDRTEVEKIAVLARIAITEQEITATTERLNGVLNLINQLQAVNTDGVEPMAHPLDAVQRLRADEVSEHNSREAFQHIAPATESGLYLVPRVID